MMWLVGIDNAASEQSGGPVGPGAGRELMLLYIGRIVALFVGVYELIKALRPQG